MVLLERLGGIEEGSVLLRLVRADTLHEAGRTDEAKTVLAAAVREIEERAGKLADDEARRLFRDRVPENRDALLRAKEWG